tara:strand:+ start:3582 stop:4739 length:1158 start_codon:yes stop_codon:yes gene_type:complete
MDEFDIILVFYLSRKHDYYLHIIKELSSKYRIGLLLSDEENFFDSRKGHRKVINSERQFLSLCVQLGAEKIFVNQEVRGKIIIIPLLPLQEMFHTEDYMSKFETNISWDKLIGLFFFKDGVKQLGLIKSLGIKKYFVPAKYLFETRSKYEGKLKEVEKLELVEIGFPYKKYPIFDRSCFDIDYLVAYPSHVHFRNNKGKEKYMFMTNLYSMLKTLDEHNKIYLKKHNNNDKSGFFPSLSAGPTWLLKVSILIVDLSLALSPVLRQQLYRIGVKLKNSVIERKYPTLEDITEHHNLGIENFLPYVRKGLITGSSASQFHALYNELPVYNCDSQVDDEVATLPYNKEFLVPFCGGKLVFDQSNFNRISKECKSADMINLIKGELNGL